MVGVFFPASASIPEIPNRFTFLFLFYSFFNVEDMIMGNFPKSEAEIIVLGNEVKAGLATHTSIYPEPPIPSSEMATILTAMQAAIDKVTAARAAAEGATVEKVAALENLVSALKKNLKYAENTVDGDDTKLKLLGWSARKDPTPTTPPGQARQLVVYPQGEGWLDLEWLTPVEGGKTTGYNVQRRLRTEAAWTQIASTYERKITLQNQPRGVELEYTVVATNKAGDGPVSNAVMVVL